MRNRPQISLITPTITIPKAVAYFNTLPIGPPNAGQPNPPQFLRDGMRRSCTLLQRHVLVKMRNRPQISLITPKITIPKAVTYFNTPLIGPPKSGQPNPPWFLRDGMRRSCTLLQRHVLDKNDKSTSNIAHYSKNRSFKSSNLFQYTSDWTSQSQSA